MMKKKSQSNHNLWAGLILLLTFGIMSSCSTSDDVNPNNMNQQNGNNSTDDSAPDFTLTALDGSQFKMSDQRDNVVVLFFFGSSCPSCRAVGSDIEKKLNTDFGANADYTIVGLDQWNETSSSVESFKTRTNITFPLLLNASQVAGSYSTTYDRLIVVDKKGKFVHKGSRAAANDINTVVAVVKDLLDDM